MATFSPVSPLDQRKDSQSDPIKVDPYKALPARPESIEEKQVFSHDGKYSVNPAFDGGSNKILATEENKRWSPSIFLRRYPKRIFAIVFAIIAILIISISVAVTQTRRAERNRLNDEAAQSDASSENATNPASPVIGTKLVRQERDCGMRHMLFYQSQDNLIRSVRADETEAWQPPDPEPLPANNAIPVTPLAGACMYTNNQDGTCYIFYVDTDLRIQGVRQQETIDNACADVADVQWEPSNIGEMNYHVPPGSQITFAAIDTGNVNHSSDEDDAVTGIILVATNVDGAVQEYRFDSTNGTWTDRPLPSETLNRAYSGADIDFYEDHYALMWLGPGDQRSMAYYNASDEDFWFESDPPPPGPPALFNSSVCAEEVTVVWQDESGRLYGNDGFEAEDGTGANGVDWATPLRPNNNLDILLGTGIVCMHDPSESISFSVIYQTDNGDIQESYYPEAGEMNSETAFLHRNIISAAPP